MRADFRIGQLLAELRDGHLFNDDWTFGQYVQRRFDMGYRQAVRLIEAWRVVEDLELYAHGCPMPCCERSVRDLAQLPPGPERGRAWRVAVERAGGRRPTAALVREVVQSMRRPKAEDVAEFFRQGGEASA